MECPPLRAKLEQQVCPVELEPRESLDDLFPEELVTLEDREMTAPQECRELRVKTAYLVHQEPPERMDYPDVLEMMVETVITAPKETQACPEIQEHPELLVKGERKVTLELPVYPVNKDVLGTPECPAPRVMLVHLV